MRNMLILFFTIVSSMLFAKTQTTHIAQLNLNSNAGSVQSMCLMLSSDKERIITRSEKNIDIWNAKDLKHLGRIENTKQGWGCDLHQNNRYFLVHDLRGIALYDLKTLKQIKTFSKAEQKHGDSLVAASFSSDGNSINSYEEIVVKPRLRKPFLFRYHIASGKREKIKAFPPQMNSNKLQNDKLYTLDMHKSTSLTVYDIQTDTQKNGDKKDRQIYDSLYGWWDCNAKSPKTKICLIDNGIKYSLAGGNLKRIDLNANKKQKAKITFIQKKPLRKAYFYETGFKYPYLINKSTQQYYGWDISKGKQIWSIRQRLTISTEFDSVPYDGILFFKHQKRAMVMAGFQGDVLDFNISNGHFRYIPKEKNRGSYIKMELSEDNKQLHLWMAKQIPPLDEYQFTFNTVTRELSPKHTDKAFRSSEATKDSNYFVQSGENFFDLYRWKGHRKLARFSVYEKGEWSVMTQEGYFNASSYNVLVNLLKEKGQKTTLENMQALAKKWYRPDIVEAILTDKDFSKLENRTSNFSLPLKAIDNNAFKESLKVMIKEDKRLDLLRLFKKNHQREDLPFIFKGIENAQTTEICSAYYRTLLFYHFRRDKLKAFIASRIKLLSAHPLEQAPLLRYIYAKHGPKKKTTYILDIVKNTELTDEAKMVIAKRCKSDTFKTLEPLLWEVWEKQFAVSSSVYSYLNSIDPSRAKKAKKMADRHHADRVLASIPKVYKELKETKKLSRERNNAARELMGLYKTLNDLNTTADVSVPIEIAMANLDAFLNQTEFNPYETAPYLQFMMKYGSDIQKKILHTKIEIYVLSFFKEAKKHNTYALGTLLKDYFPYKPEFVLTTMNKLTKSPIRSVRSNIAYTMRNFKDPKFIPHLLKMLDFKDEMVSNSALTTLLQYDDTVIKQVIPKLNALKECSKIRYLDITNSTIARKVDKATYATYRCGN